MSDIIGKELGPYRILEQIGLGGMATVYKAYHAAMDRHVAVKVLSEHMARDAGFRQRFQQEAQVIAKLTHAHILPVHDYGEEGDRLYLATRYVGAGTLKERMAAGPMDLDEINRILRQVGGALAYAHRMGVVHRDVKPSNVLLDAQGDCYLTDFGLAKMMEASARLTATGVGLGTPAYMSPEQGQGEKIDARSDIYSLGVMLYEMVTGRVPFEAETPMAVVLKHISAPLPLPSEVKASVPSAVERVILKALAKDPDDRFSSVEDMVSALESAVRLAETGAQAVQLPEGRGAVERPAKAFPARAAIALRGALGTRGGRIALWAAGGVVLVAALAFILSRIPLRVQISGGRLEVVHVVDATPVQTLVEQATTAPTPQPSATPVPIPAGPEEGKIVQRCEDVTLPQLCIRDVKTNRVVQITDDLEFEEIGGEISWSPDGKQIVFDAASVAGARPKLFRINADGTGLTPITSGRTYDFFPVWSPDEQWIAFHHDGGVGIVRPDGSDIQTLIEGTEKFEANVMAWSPDSQQIAVVNAKVLLTEIWIVNRDGSDARVVYAFDEPSSARPYWSPDGQIAIDSDDGVLLINPDGSGEPQRITEIPLSWGHNFWPRWSGEDSTAIAAEPTPAPQPTDTPVPAPAGPEVGKRVVACGDASPQLCIRDVKTNQSVKITDDLQFESIEGVAWSPDGQQIASVSFSDADDWRVYVINADGSDLRPITSGGSDGGDVDWSPDGEWIAFSSSAGLWLVHPDGSDEHVLLDSTDDRQVSMAQWSPDGRQLSFVTDFSVWVVDRDGSDPHVVYTSERLLEGHGGAAWSPDGRQMAVDYQEGDGRPCLLINADGSGEAQRLDKCPGRWGQNFWPRWGGGAGTPSATTVLAHWPFDGDLKDASGNGYDLQATGENLDFAPGCFGQAVHFNDDDASYLTRGQDDAAFDFGDRDYAIEFWLKFDQTPGESHEQTLIEKCGLDGCGPDGWGLTVLNTGPDAETFRWVQNERESEVLWPIKEGQWYHVVIVRRDRDTQVYVNGQEAISLEAEILQDSDSPLILGHRADPGQKFPFIGALDEVIIYEGALSAADVQARYQQGASCAPAATAPTAMPGDVNLWGDMYCHLEGPASDPASRNPTTGFDAVIEGRDAAQVVVESPGGETVVLTPFGDIYGRERRFGGMSPGLPQAGETYTFTALDADGAPIAGAVASDVYLGGHEPDPPANVQAEVVETGILLTWDPSPVIPGAFDPNGSPPVGSYSIFLRREDGELVYGWHSGGRPLPETSYLIPLRRQDFDPGDTGLALEELDDGVYYLTSLVFSVAPEGAIGDNVECVASDPAQDIRIVIEDGQMRVEAP